MLWALALVAHSWLLEGSNTPKAGEDPRADVPAHRAGLNISGEPQVVVVVVVFFLGVYLFSV